MTNRKLEIRNILYRIGMWFSFVGGVVVLVNRMDGHGTGWQAYTLVLCLGIVSITFAHLWERAQRPWKMKYQKAVNDLDLLEHVPPELVRIAATQYCQSSRA
jgi:hypothetical protein